MLRMASSLALLLNLGLYDSCFSEKTGITFTFKEYQYKDSPKNEMTFREFETACEQSSACNQISGLPRTRCVRECVSPSCYREIYSSDPLLTITFYKKEALMKRVVGNYRRKL